MRKLTAHRVHLPRRLLAPGRPLDAFSRLELQAIVDHRSTTASPTTTASRRQRRRANAATTAKATRPPR